MFHLVTCLQTDELIVCPRCHAPLLSSKARLACDINPRFARNLRQYRQGELSPKRLCCQERWVYDPIFLPVAPQALLDGVRLCDWDRVGWPVNTNITRALPLYCANVSKDRTGFYTNGNNKLASLNLAGFLAYTSFPPQRIQDLHGHVHNLEHQWYITPTMVRYFCSLYMHRVSMTDLLDVPSALSLSYARVHVLMYAFVFFISYYAIVTRKGAKLIVDVAIEWTEYN